MNWSHICKPKKDGGLGVRNLELWNVIAVDKLAWHVCMLHESLWVKWVHGVYVIPWI